LSTVCSFAADAVLSSNQMILYSNSDPQERDKKGGEVPERQKKKKKLLLRLQKEHQLILIANCSFTAH
jgi:predicted HicB family RNase H-like nuclease